MHTEVLILMFLCLFINGGGILIIKKPDKTKCPEVRAIKNFDLKEVSKYNNISSTK